MKQNFYIKVLNRFLALLGITTLFSGCAYGPINDFPVMYGTPNMDFKVSGKVTDKESNPIPGIKISCTGRKGFVEVYSAMDGSFSTEGNGTGACLYLEDVDGQENGGEFFSKEENIEVEKISDGDGGWYRGKFEARDVSIVMDKK